ncbi:MAG: 2-hydroxyacyl-CoA dehydratase family protein, partial [Syntrophomonas sp.]|nr:2-hydroxyacyl-CoA dehydratase family protein [Syntrophomonas sp.]
MDVINNVLAEMNQVVSSPGQVIKDYKKNTGKKVVGCFPVYCPEEIVHAAGMLPIGMWGGQTQISLANTIMPAFACSIMQSIMDFALRGVYNELDAVIISAPCDTLKSIGQDWGYAIPQIKSILTVYPQMRKIEAGVQYLKTEFQNIKKEIEAISGETITDEALQKSIEVYNEHRQALRNFCSVARMYPLTITPTVRHLVIKSGYFMEKGQHTLLVNELVNELSKRPAEKFKGKKVILTGIMAEPNGLLELFSENGLTVVGDDLAQESRQFRTDVPAGDDPLIRLARQWSLVEGCSLAYDPDKKRGDMLIDMAKETGADAIVLCMMKFCDPEEFDYAVLSAQFEEAGIPMLYLEIDQQMQSLE